MQLTEFGKSFIVLFMLLVIWSIWLSRKWIKRSSNGEKAGCLGSGYFFLIVFSISSLFFTFAYVVPQSLYHLWSKPSFDAVITGYHSEWVDETRTDSNGHSYTTQVLMHTPQVTFVDQNHQQITLDNSIRSGRVPVIGEHIQIVYAAGDDHAQEKSLRSVLLQLCALFMVFILGFVLLCIFAYSLGRDMQPYRTVALFILMKIVIPLGTMAMFSMLCYSIFAYFYLGNPNELPFWVIGLCGFFALMLLPLLYHILTGWKAYQK